MSEDIRNIAASLSRKERELIAVLPRIGGHKPKRWMMRLCDIGIADCTIKGDDTEEGWFFTLTDLGLAVRATLTTKDADHG